MKMNEGPFHVFSSSSSSSSDDDIQRLLDYNIQQRAIIQHVCNMNLMFCEYLKQQYRKRGRETDSEETDSDETDSSSSSSVASPFTTSSSSAAYDLSSSVEIKIPARGTALVPANFTIAIPEGTYAQIAPRSGLAMEHSIDVRAGVVDAGHSGPVGVILFNHSDVDFEVKHGDKIALLIIEKIVTLEVTEVDDLDSTARSSGRFG